MAQYKIRSASKSDAGVLTDFRIRLFQEAGDGSDPASFEGFRDVCVKAFVRGFKSKTCLAWLAEDDAGHCLGTLVMMLLPRLPSPKIPNGADEGYVLNVYVVPESRRQGIAAALFAAALEQARALGLARLRLHTTPEGRTTYLRVGFAPRDNEMELLLGPK